MIKTLLRIGNYFVLNAGWSNDLNSEVIFHVTTVKGPFPYRLTGQPGNSLFFHRIIYGIFTV